LKDHRYLVVEDICKRFGADRIIFGTYYYGLLSGTPASPLLVPSCVPSSSRAMVTYADISEEEKGMVAGGNLRRLLGISSKPSVKYSFTSKIQRLASQGEKLPTTIIDSHFHLDPDIYGYKPGTSLASIIKMMDITGINKICINSSKALWGGNHYEGNNYIASVCKKYPERFLGFAIINPKFDDTEDEIKRCIEVLGLKGIKIHPRIHQCDLADERYKPVWEASEKYQIPILSHTAEAGFGSNPKVFEEISKNYPKGTFLLGHAATTKTSIDIAKKRNNVYLDTVVSSVNGSIEHTVSQIGADKILFGSDCPFYDFNFALGYILYARISDEDKAKILGLNMRKILKI
jgi:predicted TIM-barrel fold metal-dependent hydrolase